MKKILTKLFIFIITLIVLIFLAVKVTFVPFLEGLIRILAAVNVFLVFFYVALVVSHLTSGKKVLRIVAYIITVGVFVIIAAYIFLVLLFTYSGGTKFTYKDKVYYYSDEGFLDTDIVIYEKSSPLTLKAIKEYQSDRKFSPTEEIAIMVMEDAIDDYLYSSRKPKEPAADEREILPEVLDKEIIEGTDFAVVQVDAAGPSRKYVFAKKSGDKWEKISDIPVYHIYTGAVVEGDNIELYFTDTNGDMYTAISNDGGLTWREE